MAIVLDALSAAPYSGVTGGTAKTFNHTGALGACVFLAINTNTAAALSAVSYGSTSLTVSASPPHNTTSTGSTFLYVLTGGGTGNSETVSFTTSISCAAVANVISYTGVGSVSAPSSSQGFTTGPATNTATLTPGQWAVGFIGNAASNINSVSGGINRYLGFVTSSGSHYLNISDRTDSGAFSETAAGNTGWGSVIYTLTPVPVYPPKPVPRAPILRSAYY